MTYDEQYQKKVYEQALLRQIVSLSESKTAFIDIRPNGDWEHWGFQIWGPGAMSPFFLMANSGNEEYPTYMDAAKAALARYNQGTCHEMEKLQ